jgi:hypothetical protein
MKKRPASAGSSQRRAAGIDEPSCVTPGGV